MAGVRGMQVLERLMPASLRAGERWVLAGVSALFLTYQVVVASLDRLWLFFLPLGALLVLYMVEAPQVVFLIIVAFVPFSQQTVIPGTGSALQIPTEPLIMVMMVVLLLRAIASFGSKSAFRSRSSRRIDVALAVFWAALGISVFSSTMPFVTLKHFANFTWYTAICYLFVRVSMNSMVHLEHIVTTAFLATIGVVIYAVTRFAAFGIHASHLTSSLLPFFEEHGSYAAYLSIILGWAIGVSFGAGKRKWLQRLGIVTTLITSVGVTFSYTRAAYVGVAVLLLFVGVLKARDFLRFRTFLAVAVIASVLSVAVIGFGVNSSLEKSMTSITDVEKNLSNLERFNRWIAAVNIIRDRPILGVGFGTYPYMYWKYRERKLWTPVSDFYGFPHNDYLQYFAEAGIPGFLGWMGFLIVLFGTGVMGYFRIRDELPHNLLLGFLGGVLTYCVHCFFNGFLQFDKVAVPFWVSVGGVAVILDLFRRPKSWPSDGHGNGMAAPSSPQ